MSYKLTSTDSIIRLADGAIIPAASGNCDWVEYQVWLSEDGVPTPADVPVPRQRYVPVYVARERLEAQGKWLAIATLLFAPENQDLLLKLLTLSEGIDPADVTAHAFITAVGADPAVILA